MKYLSLLVTDVDPDLDMALVKRVRAACRNVRITRDGYFIRKRREAWPTPDWRVAYEKSMAKMFPSGWIYRGGHHVAVHASPPLEPKRTWAEPGGSAGRCLFRIVES